MRLATIRFTLIIPCILLSLVGCFGTSTTQLNQDVNSEIDGAGNPELGTDMGNPDNNEGKGYNGPREIPNVTCEGFSKLGTVDHQAIIGSICERLVSCGIKDDSTSCQEELSGDSGNDYRKIMGLPFEDQYPATHLFQYELVYGHTENFMFCYNAIQEISCESVESQNGAATMLPFACYNILYLDDPCEEKVEMDAENSDIIMLPKPKPKPKPKPQPWLIEGAIKAK